MRFLAKKKICPECGADISDIDVVAHMNQHYEKAPDPRLYPEAAARYDKLKGMIE